MVDAGPFSEYQVFLLVTNGHQIIVRFDPLTTDHGGG